MYLEAILVTEEYRKFKSKKYINFPEKFNLRELLLSVAIHNYIMKYLIFCMGSVFCDKIEYLGLGSLSRFLSVNNRTGVFVYVLL